uniref:Uncharacterized protein LOC105041811 n=1 Tax=Elaeis guineensis var. tenera TaxID=51953 RepID=A0A6I9QXY7_ELAGV|nr:uncharacterized protein LOC105041811 [Elaeis guineensis]
MSIQHKEQQITQRKISNSQPSSPNQRSPVVGRKSQRHDGCCRIFAMLISVLSETQQPSKASLQQQVGELREELQRQRELKDTYKARMERMQDYVRFCLDIAQQNGFLHHISNNQQPPHPTEFNHETTSKPVDRMTGDPHLAAIRDQAKINGWFIEPHEVSICIFLFQSCYHSYVIPTAELYPTITPPFATVATTRLHSM